MPDGDLFRAISQGRASVVTDTIETFTESGLRLASGQELEADVVVTATGLTLLPFGACAWSSTAPRSTLPDTMAYKALMLSGVPNFVYTIGYTNASWTLKADLVAEFVCRLLEHMDLQRLPFGGAGARPVGRGGAVHGLPGRATCCAPWTGCPSRGPGSRGSCGRATGTTAG